MRKKYIFGKKLYISILTSILVLLTTVATTFAWVGVFANSTFETFNFDIKSSRLEEYGIEISLDGKKFGTEISFDDIKPQILKNWGYEGVDSMTKKQINLLFGNLNQDQCTTIPTLEGGKIKKLGNFTDIFGAQTTKYFKFDIYVSAVQFYDSGSGTDYKLEAYLSQGLLRGTTKNYELVHSFTYPIDYINPYDNMIANGTFALPNTARTIQANEKIIETRVNSASAARIAFEKYEVVQKGHPEQYTDEMQPKSALIYQDSYEYPVYDDEDETYSFGAILPDDSNLAVGYYNSTEYKYFKYKIKSVSVPDEVLNTRSVDGLVPDIRLSSKTNQLINPTDSNEQIGVNQMMKLTIYFWFEGWDADCFPVINYSPVNINISFMMTNEEDF